jgi:type I restriction enzyme S subunit
MSCIATIGKCGITTRPSFTNQQINSVICGDDFDPKFLYYCFKQLVSSLDAAGGGGSVYTNVSKSRFSAIEIVLPPIKEQKAISGILGVLDDKIELNRQMNKTLEAMARAIFKSWFIDFDPVRIKAEGKRMKAEKKSAKNSIHPSSFTLPPSLLDLFPDSFEDSELGEIPKGWEVFSFADTIKIFGGGTPKTSISEYWDGDIPWYTVGDAPDTNDVYVINTTKKITKLGVEKSSTQILPIETTIISARGTVGKLALTGVPMAMNQTCYGLRGNIKNSNYLNSSQFLYTRFILSHQKYVNNFITTQ